MIVPPQYLTDASGFKGFADRIFSPADDRELVAILEAAMKDRVPITVAGAGSGLTGSRVPQGGWVLSLEKFRQLEIGHAKAVAGPAVTLLELRDTAARTRQFFAPDPTEITASIGGAIATNASGARSFRYGSTRRHVVALKIALMNGKTVEYRRGEKIDFDVPAIPIPDTTKYTAGYRLQPGMDWIDLFCGSEGTLGIILEAELALLPIPREIFAGVVFFPSDEQALCAVDEWRPLRELRMLEYADRNSLDLLLARYPEIPPEARAALLIEAEGEDVESWDTRLAEAGALTEASWFATAPTDRERFRLFRHSLPELVIDTVGQEAHAAALAAKYYPLGTRGLAAARAANYGQVLPFSFAEHTARSNAETLVIAQVETPSAIEQLPAILEAPEIDVIFVGPSDLSLSLGVPGDWQHPKLLAAFDKIIAAVQGSDKALGILVPTVEAALQWQARGARYIMAVMEAILAPTVRSFLTTLRQS